MSRFIFLLTLCGVLLLSGCAKHKSYDYTAFRASKPASILVLPAENSTPDINAANSFISGVTKPLAEAGYYVFPVAVVDETFKHNGLTNAHDVRTVSLAKLRDIFNADAILYIDVSQYGSKYRVVDSMTEVAASAKLVDLRNGSILWQGTSFASDQNNNSNNSLLGIVVGAVVKHVANNITDESHKIALRAADLLFATNDQGGLLPGPRRHLSGG